VNLAGDLARPGAGDQGRRSLHDGQGAGAADPLGTNLEMDALVLNLKDVVKRVFKLMPEIAQGGFHAHRQRDRARQIADLITSNLDVQVDENRRFGDLRPQGQAAARCCSSLSRQHEVLRSARRSTPRYRRRWGATSVSTFLRQQLKAIKEESGRDRRDGRGPGRLPGKIAAAKMPGETEKVAVKQLEASQRSCSLRRPEYTVTPYLSGWLVELPWRSARRTSWTSRRPCDTPHADHYRPTRSAKKRIWNNLRPAAADSRQEGAGFFVCGPAWCGKTSLGKSIARALAASSCGCRWAGCAMRPRSAVHRRTTLGRCRVERARHEEGGIEQPGVHARRNRQAGHDFRGDPAAALLEVLEPGAEP